MGAYKVSNRRPSFPADAGLVHNGRRVPGRDAAGTAEHSPAGKGRVMKSEKRTAGKAVGDVSSKRSRSAQAVRPHRDWDQIIEPGVRAARDSERLSAKDFAIRVNARD